MNSSTRQLVSDEDADVSSNEPGYDAGRNSVGQYGQDLSFTLVSAKACGIVAVPQHLDDSGSARMLDFENK